jgi:sortase A
MKNVKRGTIFIRIGLLLVVAALFLVVYNYYEDCKASLSVVNVLEQLEINDDVELVTDIGMPEMEVDGYTYIGKLTIPSLELELPIINQWDYDALKVAPCRYSGAVLTDNLIILAHNYSSHFGRIKELEIDDVIVFTDILGNNYYYKVVQKEILKPNAVDELESGDWDLTLVTCTIGGSTRVTIRCDRTDKN